MKKLRIKSFIKAGAVTLLYGIKCPAKPLYGIVIPLYGISSLDK